MPEMSLCSQNENNKYTYKRFKNKIGFNELHDDNRKDIYDNKLKCYRVFKTRFGFECCLSVCHNDTDRKHMPRLHALKWPTKVVDRLKPEERNIAVIHNVNGSEQS